MDPAERGYADGVTEQEFKIVKPFRWGIFGTGAISAKFSQGLKAAYNAEPVFVASRNLSRAQAFAGSLRIPHAIEGYEAAATSGMADAIYIASPPAEHARLALMCIEAGVPVLIEKPFASSAADAQRIANAARAHGIFAMEAMWTRFLPAAQAFKERLASGVLGEVHMLSGCFGTAKQVDPRNGAFDPARGGGAMAQLGTYPVSLAQWLLGTPVGIQASGRMGETGVDEDAAFTLRFANGATGSFYASIRAWAPNDFQAMGPDGILGFHGPLYRPNGLRLTRQAPQRFSTPRFDWKMRMKEQDVFHRIAQMMGWSARDRARVEPFPYRGNGYHYEADEVQQCIARGAIESAIMPLDDSIAVARTVDAIRAGVAAGQASSPIWP